MLNKILQLVATLSGGASFQALQYFSMLKASKFIGTTSGPGVIAAMLGIDTLLLNANSLTPSMPATDRCILGIKNIRLKKLENRECPKDKLKYLLLDWGYLVRSGILVVESLTPIEIENDLKDFESFAMRERGNKWPFTLKHLTESIPNMEIMGDVYYTERTMRNLMNILLVREPDLNYGEKK